MFFHIHENKSGEFKPTYYDFNSRTSVPTPAPRVLNVGYFAGVDSKCYGEHLMTVVYTFFHPVEEFAIVCPVENMVSHHFKGGQMAT
jgi:hypothetical protein